MQVYINWEAWLPSEETSQTTFDLFSLGWVSQAEQSTLLLKLGSFKKWAYVNVIVVHGISLTLSARGLKFNSPSLKFITQKKKKIINLQTWLTYLNRSNLNSRIQIKFQNEMNFWYIMLIPQNKLNIHIMHIMFTHIIWFKWAQLGPAHLLNKHLKCSSSNPVI